MQFDEVLEMIKCYAGFPRSSRGITETRRGEGCDSGKVNFVIFLNMGDAYLAASIKF